MNVEQTLIQELDAVARAVETPPPPAPAALVQAAEQTRTRTRLRGAVITLAAAAAVVGAVVAGGQLGGPDSAPSPTHPTPTHADGDLPAGPAPRLPYVLERHLYVDGKAQPGLWSWVVTAGRTTVAVPDETGGQVALFHDGVEVARLPSRTVDTQSIRLSPLGTKVAWSEFDDDSAHIVVHDMDRARDLGRLPVDRATFAHDGEETEGWENLQAVADDGTVTYGGVLVVHTWKPGTAPVDHDPTGYGQDAPEGYPKRAYSVIESSDGAWGAWASDRTGNPDPAIGEDGALVYDGVTVQRPGDSASRFTFAMPRGTTEVRHVVWESPTDLLVLVVGGVIDGLPQQFVRCDVVDRTCEHAATPEDH